MKERERERERRPELIVWVNCIVSHILMSKRERERTEYIVTIEVLYRNFVRCNKKER